MRRSLVVGVLVGGVLASQAPALPERPSSRPGSTSAPAVGKGEKRRGKPARPAPGKTGRRLRERREKTRKIAALNRKLTRLFQQGKYAECEPLLRQVLRIDPKNHVAWYNLACYHSRVGEKGKAIESLEKAVELGYSEFRHLERDPDLAAIRGAPGYKRLIARKAEIQRQRAAKIRQMLRAKFGEGYLHEIDHDRKLVFATNVDRHTLADMKQRLTAYATAQQRHLFTYPFEQYLTIVIPRSSDWPTSPAVGGFYNRGAHVLYAQTVGLTLLHEFTHALHGADQEGLGQHHPIWITEGLATLFESSKVVAGRAVPQPNRRLIILRRIVQRGRHIPFKDFVRFSHAKFMGSAATAYCQSRYMLAYLHRKGVLKKWYDAYTEGYGDDRTGAEAMEKVLGKKLREIEKDWKAWVLTLEPPVLRLPARHAYLGIQLRPGVDGVRVVRVVPGSGADKAGLKADDVIIQIDGERVIDPGQLMTVVYRHEVGDKLKVRYRRGTTYRTATVTLGAMPDHVRPPAPPRRPRTRPATKPARKKAA